TFKETDSPAEVRETAEVKKRESTPPDPEVRGFTDFEQVLQGLKMIEIPSGEFEMGSEDGEDREKPVHPVKLQAFEISATPITQAQYEAVMGTNPSEFKGADRPVETVSWDDAKVFCERLTKMAKASGRVFTLPCEAQWEYACRAGSTTRYCFGDDEAKLGEYAWYDKNSKGQTQPVGQKRPNDWGLYDMHGNVWEWVEDDWHDNYRGAPVDGRAWVDNQRGAARVIRGGSWGSGARGCRSAIRGGISPDDRDG
ncbi:MAG: formylglycine-generating enzyme family protein, partial [Planctomycetes bacterium]|nr:formylglycine-generating enzyme family protein [Planctomycetota bacterium]